MFGFIKKIFQKVFAKLSDTKAVKNQANDSVVNPPPPPKYDISFDSIYRDLEAESNDLIAKYN
jgi:hypothetical protein